MDAIEAIRTRRSIRTFKPDPVPRKVLGEILDAARWTPSWANTQPWEFAVVGGKVLDELKDRFEQRVREKATETPDIPKPVFVEPYLTRIRDLRDILDPLLYPPGAKLTPEMRDAYHIKVARFQGAPNAIIVYTDRSLCPYIVHDIGAVVLTICLAAHVKGLGTCITVRVAYYPDILREVLHIPQSKVIVMGIDIGYPVPEAPYNNFTRVREPLDALVHWHGV